MLSSNNCSAQCPAFSGIQLAPYVKAESRCRLSLPLALRLRSVFRPTNVRWARAGLDDFIFKDASAAAATDGRVCDWDSLFRSFSIYKWVRNRRLASRLAIVATAGASLILKSSNRARAHLTLIGRKTDRNRNGTPNRQCDSAFKSLSRALQETFRLACPRQGLSWPNVLTTAVARWRGDLLVRSRPRQILYAFS